MTHLVQFLRREGLDAVKTKLSVATCRHKQHPQLILFKYDQINSPFNNKVVRNCRGIILDESDDWRIVSYPYDKFFNLGMDLLNLSEPKFK
jgi:tRNA splicing ligase